MLAKTLPERFIIVDGTKSLDAVESFIWSELRKRVI